MKLTATFIPQTLSVSIQDPSMGISFANPVARDYVERDPYDGPYEITPAQEAQVLATDQKRMTGDVKVGPIPSNWGRIEYDGSVMTIS